VSDAPPRILVAGVGNIFLGDDGFGVEVVQQLARRPLPANVRVEDFGIRGFDLSYRLLDNFDAVILVDAAPRGHAPGTVTLIEPAPVETTAPPAPGEGVMIDTHNMDPLRVLRFVAAMGGTVRRILVVACEPQPFDADADDMQVGLSPPVQAAVDEAIAMIESLVNEPGGILCTSSPSP
jgi:hydrogenase maturation protease